MTVFPFPELDGEKEAEYEIFPINLTRMLHTQRQDPAGGARAGDRAGRCGRQVRIPTGPAQNRRPCALEQARKCLRS